MHLQFAYNDGGPIDVGKKTDETIGLPLAFAVHVLLNGVH